MPTFNVTVRRMRVWNYTVEADNAEDAKDKGDEMANDDHDHPNDDYAYETSARWVGE